MKRLRKIADEQEIMNTNESLPEETHLQQNNNLDTIKNLLVRIDNNVEDIKLSYYSLLENLNALSKEFPNVYNELENAKVVLKQLGPELAVCAALVLLNPEIDGKDIVLSKEPRVSMKKAKSYKRSEPKSKKSSRGTSHKSSKKQEEKPKQKEETKVKVEPKQKKEEPKKEPKSKSLKERVLIELEQNTKSKKDSKGKKKTSSPKGKKTTKSSKNGKRKLADLKF